MAMALGMLKKMSKRCRERLAQAQGSMDPLVILLGECLLF